MKGDRVEVVIDTGGASRTFELTATRAGRRVEVVTGRGVVQVMEVTRGGTAVRTARFMASRVIAVVEHPARDREAARDASRGPAREAAAGPGRDPRAAPGDGPGAAPAASMLDDAVDRTAAQLG